MLQRGPSLTIALLILLGSVGPAVSQTGQQFVEGIEGQPVTLPCTYKGATTTMCWGRGSCPKSKCNDVLIWTDGQKVTHRSSDRYRLNDQIHRRQVSLTIAQARMDDEGTYCCRVEHAGWFNDDLFEIKLNMRKAPTTTRPPPTTTTKAPTTTTTKAPMTTTTTPSTTAATTTLPPTPPRTTPTPRPEIVTTLEPTDETTVLPITVEDESGTDPQPTHEENTPSPSVGFPYDPMTTLRLPDVRTSFPPSAIPTDKSTNEPEPRTTAVSDVTYESNVVEKEHYNPSGQIPPQHDINSGANEIVDHLHAGNETAVEKREGGLSQHIIITAVCLSIIVLVVVTLLILKFKGKERGHYPVGLDPNLELVNHAEDFSHAATLEVDNVKVNGTNVSWEKKTED